MKVIEALEQNGIGFDGPAGKTTIDPQTHHAILDVNIGEVKDQKLDVLEKLHAAAAGRHAGGLRPQEEPEREQAVRDRRQDLIASSGPRASRPAHAARDRQRGGLEARGPMKRNVP